MHRRAYLSIVILLCVFYLKIVPFNSPLLCSSDNPHLINLKSGLIGYWKLQGDCHDYSGKENHGINKGVDLVYSEFNGRNSYIEVPDTPALNFNTDDFSVSVWIYTENDLSDVIGDVLSKYDPVQRRGFTLYVKSSSGGYNSQGNDKHVYFGIDNGRESDWEDCGKPGPTSNFCTSLTVYNGKLFTGINDAANEEDWCKVYAYEGGKSWRDCGRVGTLRTPGVVPLIVHNGKLYAAASSFDWVLNRQARLGQAALDYSRVYCYEGNQQWRECGQPGKGYRITALASYNGKLYANVDDKHDGYFKCFVYDGNLDWELCGKFRGVRTSMTVHDGKLFTGEGHFGEVHAFDGKYWQCLGNPGGSLAVCNQIHVMEIHRGNVFAGLWKSGKVSQYQGPAPRDGSREEWKNCGRLGESLEIMSMTMYNGKFYAGSLPRAEVYRYEGGEKWTLVKRFYDGYSGNAQDYSRVSSLTVYNGKLFATITTSRGSAKAEPTDNIRGKVYAMEAGKNVSYDDDLGSGWKHLTAVKDGDKLTLYVNGRLVAASSHFESAEYDISNNEPLKIGFGEMDYFTGKIREVRLYNRALGAGEIQRIYRMDR